MTSRVSSLTSVLMIGVSLAACTPEEHLSGPIDRQPLNSISASAVSVLDVSNGITGGGARTISATGIVLGKTGASRGWWQSPSPSFTKLDEGYVQGGNRNADAGGGQGTAILSTNGGAPWTDVALASPPGISAGATVAHDINSSRVLVGNTLGSNVYAIRWDSPSSIPAQLPLPPLQYPAYQVVARSINDFGVIVGYVIETLPKNRSRYEALVWTNGTAIILPLPAGSTSQLASNINNAGVISGILDGIHPIRWTPRSDGGYDVAVSSINVGRSNLDTGIDDCGRVTGGSDAGAWVWDGINPAVVIPGLKGPGYWAQASDINESGTMVGSSFVSTLRGASVTRATIWTGLPAC